jgi:hypothetical protein
MHSLLPSHTARASDCGSAVPLLGRTGAACGLLSTLRAVHDFLSHCRSTEGQVTQLSQEIALEPLTEREQLRI